MNIKTLQHNKAKIDRMAAKKKADSDYHKQYYIDNVKEITAKRKAYYIKNQKKKKGYASYELHVTDTSTLDN